MPSYSPMDEVEVQDVDYLPLASVPACTHGSDQNNTVLEGDGWELR